VSALQTLLTTVEHFLTLPDPPAGHLELHHGVVVNLPPRPQQHTQLQQALLQLLLPFTLGKGFLTIELPFRPRPEYEIWQADLGFVERSRWANEQGTYLSGAPNLVVEVLSPSNTLDEMSDRMSICFENGCSSFWIVDPKRRTISVTEADLTKHYRVTGTLPLPPPLQGTLSVSDVFETA
jgi:Uma2 family endonuclease